MATLQDEGKPDDGESDAQRVRKDAYGLGNPPMVSSSGPGSEGENGGDQRDGGGSAPEDRLPAARRQPAVGEEEQHVDQNQLQVEGKNAQDWNQFAVTAPGNAPGCALSP